MTMKCLATTISAFLLAIPAICMAGWEVARPNQAIPNEPFFQAGTQQPEAAFIPTTYGSNSFPNQFANLGRPATPLYAISVSGSLKENIQRIMERYHWKVVWKVPYDFNFDGRVTG